MTSRQEEIMRFIIQHWLNNLEFPEYRQLARHFKISLTSMMAHMHRLARDGYIVFRQKYTSNQKSYIVAGMKGLVVVRKFKSRNGLTDVVLQRAVQIAEGRKRNRIKA